MRKGLNSQRTGVPFAGRYDAADFGARHQQGWR
jgi:hypothetical protein